MPQIVSFIIQKGGCGKTTTTVNTASYLALQGFKVLAVDMDPQGNLTLHFGYNTDTLESTLLHLFLNKKSFSEVVLKRDDCLLILPNNIETASVEFALYKSLSREYLLRDVLTPIAGSYDLILIDCPPNLGIFSINALCASTVFVLVISPEFFPMKAIESLYETVRMVKNRLNRSLQFKGALMTMCDFRTRHGQEIRRILEKNFPYKLYKSYIRTNVTLKEAASLGKTIFEHNARSAGAFDYRNFVEEFIRDHHLVKRKRAYYDICFQKLSRAEQEEILEFAANNLSTYNRNRLESLENKPFLMEALLIERNKILERFFPYRQQSDLEKME